MEAKSNSGQGASEVHLRDYWRVVWQGRFTGLGVFAVVMAVTALKLFVSVPQYRATATVEIRPEAKRILPGQEQWLGAQGGGWIAEEKYFNTQLEVLRSRDLAERAFRRLRLENHPRFEKLDDPIGAFQRMIEVRPKIETRLVSVSLEGPDPKEVRDWVNTLAEVYVKRNVDQAVQSFRGIMDEIEKGLATSKQNLGQADLDRLQIAADKNLFVPENQQEVLRRNLQTYNDELARTRVEIGALGSEIRNLEKLRETGGDILALPRVAQDAQVSELVGQRLTVERELQRIAAEKRPQHPDYLSRQKDLDKVNQRIQEQVGRIVEKLRTQYELATSNAAYLDGQIRRVQEESYRVQQASSSYDILKTEAQSKRKVYDTVAETMERLAMTSQLMALNNNVAILDKAIEPRHPVKPRRMIALAVGGLLGLVLGLGSILFLNYLDNTIRAPEDVENYLGLGVLAIVPKVRDATANAAKEAYQSLRTSILFSSQNRQRKVLLLASAGPQEGKSSTTAAVARTLAAAGERVVVLDCDLRRPTQHLHQKVSREPGITNYLLEARDGDYAPYLAQTDLPTLRVMPCGPIPPNPPELVGGSKFADLLSHLRRDFDWVVIDSPPIVSLSDTLVLASLADMVALVIKHNENDRDLIRRCVKQLRDVKANLIGAVLNNVDIERTFYKDYYYAGYYNYGDKDARESKGRSRKKGDDPSRQVAL